MTDRLRIGIIGSGFIARTHAHSIAHGVQHAGLSAVAGGSRAEALARDFQTTHHATVESLVASKDVGAVIIATPHQFHREHAMLCADHAKHVLIEKPMSTTVEDCAAIVDRFKNSGLRLMVAFTQRYRKSNMIACEIIHGGILGRILMIEEYALLPNGLKAYPQWQRQPENLGVLFGYGIHNIDKLRWFLRSEAESVSANVLCSTDGIETSTMATLRWTSGALTNLWSSVDLPAPGFEGTAFRSRIVGEKGLLDVDGYGEVKMALAEGRWETCFVQPTIDWQGDGMFSEARMGSFNLQNQAFVDAVLAGVEPPVTGMDGLQAVAIALAAYRSANTHQTIILNRPPIL